MDVVKGFATLALAVILFAGMPLVGAAEEELPPGVADPEMPIVEGIIEEVTSSSILVKGKYYDIDGAFIEDGRMHRAGRGRLKVGTGVSIVLGKGNEVIHIVIQEKPGHKRAAE